MSWSERIEALEDQLRKKDAEITALRSRAARAEITATRFEALAGTRGAELDRLGSERKEHKEVSRYLARERQMTKELRDELARLREDGPKGFGRQSRELRAENARLQGELDRMKHAYEGGRARVGELEDQLRARERRNAELRRLLKVQEAAAKAMSDGLVAEIARLRNGMGVSTGGEEVGLRERIEAQNRTIVDLRARLAGEGGDGGRIADLRTAHANLQRGADRTIAEANRTIADLRAALADSQEEVRQKLNQLAELRAALDYAKKQIEHQDKNIGELRALGNARLETEGNQGVTSREMIEDAQRRAQEITRLMKQAEQRGLNLGWLLGQLASVLEGRELRDRGEALSRVDEDPDPPGPLAKVSEDDYDRLDQTMPADWGPLQPDPSLSVSERLCPDDGTCHHQCGASGCWRVFNAEPLTAAGWGDKWPEDVRAAEAAKERPI